MGEECWYIASASIGAGLLFCEGNKGVVELDVEGSWLSWYRVKRESEPKTSPMDCLCQQQYFK